MLTLASAWLGQDRHLSTVKVVAGGATAAVGSAYGVDQQTICLERAPFDLVQLFLWSDEVAFAKHNVFV